MTILELKEQRLQLKRKQENLLNQIQKEKRDFNDEEKANFDSIKEEIRTLDIKIAELENWLAGQTPKKKENRRFSYVKAISAIMNGRALDDVEAEVSERGAKNSISSGSDNGFFLPMEKRATLQATVATAGKEDVATDLLDLVTPLENELIATRAGATFLTGLKGDIAVPFYTGTTAGWAGEVSPATDGAGEFKQKTLSPKRITAYVDLSKLLLIQGNDSVEAYIQSSLVEAVRQTLEETMFGTAVGTSDKPAGLLNGVTADVGDITYGALVDMETSLLTKNFRNLSWVGAYDALGVLKKTEKVSGQPVYLYEGGLIDGRNVYGSNNVGSKGLILGDFSELLIGQWGGIEVLVDPYTQALNGTVRLVVNSYFDYFVRRGFDKKTKAGIVPFAKRILK